MMMMMRRRRRREREREREGWYLIDASRDTTPRPVHGASSKQLCVCKSFIRKNKVFEWFGVPIKVSDNARK
jgi:hypothetical protein